MSCHFCCENNLDGFPEIDHPINGPEVEKWGTIHDRHLYQCFYCQVFLLKTKTQYMTGNEKYKIEHVGWNLDGIKAEEDKK